MPVFLVDLDDTLIDRQAAFASWAKSFADSNGLADGSLARLLEHDFGHGTSTLEDFFNLVRSEHRLPFTRDELIARFLDEIVGHFSPVEPDTAAALRRLRSAGWKIAVVTNGSFSVCSYASWSGRGSSPWLTLGASQLEWGRLP